MTNSLKEEICTALSFVKSVQKDLGPKFSVLYLVYNNYKTNFGNSFWEGLKKTCNSYNSKIVIGTYLKVKKNLHFAGIPA